MAALLNQGDKPRQKAKSKPIVVEYYDNHVVHSTSQEWQVPSIIQYFESKFKPSKNTRYSRNNIYARDRGTCQYCGGRVTRNEFTLDHVIPKMKGGQTTWENTVVCCVPCNTKKGSKTPAEAGMRLQRAPFRPDKVADVDGFRLAWHPSMPASWRNYMRDSLYWDGELENDNKG
jgi:5-methylcytosine-specific restriction endonuclease McrA